MSTTIYFRWDRGVETMGLIAAVNDFATSKGLAIASPVAFFPGLFEFTYLIDGSRTVFFMRLPQADFKFDAYKCRTIAWKLDPPDTKSSWALMVIARNDSDDPARDGFVGDRVRILHMFINEPFTPWRLKSHPEFLDGAIDKYHEAKRLFSAWDCDSVEVICDRTDSINYFDPDPEFENRVFRFAKEGRNILHRPLEERRMATEQEVKDLSWRVVID